MKRKERLETVRSRTLDNYYKKKDFEHDIKTHIKTEGEEHDRRWNYILNHLRMHHNTLTMENPEHFVKEFEEAGIKYNAVFYTAKKVFDPMMQYTYYDKEHWILEVVR